MIKEAGAVICRQPEKHSEHVCHCGISKMAVSEWHDGLAKSDMDPNAVRHLVNLETTITDKYNQKAGDFVDHILDVYRNRKSISLEDLIGAYQHHFNEVLDFSIQPFALYYKSIVDVGRENAQRKLGFDREARRRIKRAAVGDEDYALKDQLDQSFGKVKTVGDDVIEDLKGKWIEQGGPTDLVRQFLLDEQAKLEDEGMTRAQMREKLLELWHGQRYLLERIVRTETSNAYAKAQLQEWYDQGIREVERVEINDIKTCTLCKELSAPGRNVFQIEDLLNDSITDGYPVTYVSHPNCRGGYRPRVNFQVFDEFEKQLQAEPQAEFNNASNVETEEAKAENVPIEYQEQVQQALQDFGPDYGIQFVPEITESEIWQNDRLQSLEDLYPEAKAKSLLEMEKMENRGKIVQYTAKDGTVLVSGDAGDVNRVVIPILRQQAEQVWQAAAEDQRKWVTDRYMEKTGEKHLNLEEHGVEIVGENPFVSPLAGVSPTDYFVESYAAYVADPIRLLYMDEPMYDFLRQNFMDREYINRGGIN